MQPPCTRLRTGNQTLKQVERDWTMGCFRALLCLIFPPLAVIDRGCGALLIVTVLTLGGFWIGGVLAALFINYSMNESERKYKG